MRGPSKPRKPRPAPFSIRFSEAERAFLENKAGGVPVGTFIRNAVLTGDVQTRRIVSRHHVRDAAQLGQVLGLLGRSHLANNLNQLAKAANLGSLPVTAEVEAELRQACADVAEMRKALLLALGVVRTEEAATLRDNFAASGLEAAE